MGLIQRVAGNVIPSGKNVTGALRELVDSSTRTALSAFMPDQVEAFQITLQVAGSGTLTSFTFPVMPESLAMANRYLTTVTPTLGGVFVDDFGRAPSPIQLTGTFGRQPRRLVGATVNFQRGLTGVLQAGARDLLNNTHLVTGFGAVKLLEKLVEQSHTPDDQGKLPTTTLYNWAFNSHWDVVVTGFDVQMSVQQNGLWFYALQLTALRPAGTGLRALDRLASQAVQTIAHGQLGTAIAIASTAVRGVQTLRDLGKSGAAIKQRVLKGIGL